ncbi:hypothetical protein [Pseudonocardia sp. NPDC049154]|uniref:hypothetical protein n=1 Tax=Pseudonocardia sp. NPDC049154 TaxID=3155501 RepID=UPI0033C96862
MIERAYLIGGPMCGGWVEKPIGAEEVEVTGVGTYHRVSAVPNWMVNPSFRPTYPMFLWEPYYHDIEHPPAPPSGRPEEVS